MQPQDAGATEWLAGMSIGYVVAILFVLTIIRLAFTAQRTSFAKSIAELTESLLIAGGLVFMILRPFFLQAFYIPSESMEPTLNGHREGVSRSTGITYPSDSFDHIFANRLIYRLRDPKRGEIVVFRATKDADMENNHTQENNLIKRVVGIPGDTIEMKRDKTGVMRVWRNGQPVIEETCNDQATNEPCIREPMGEQSPFAHFATRAPLKLGPTQYFMMGDNREYSSDSRFWGVLDRSRVIGKAAIIFWPLPRFRTIR